MIDCPRGTKAECREALARESAAMPAKYMARECTHPDHWITPEESVKEISGAMVKLHRERERRIWEKVFGA